jgi:hypothetical protein
MIHMHNSLTSAVDQTTSPASRSTPVSKSTLDSFRNALSEAVSTTLSKFGIDPNQVQVSVAPSSSSATPGTSETGTQDANATGEAYNPFAQAANQSWTGIPVPSTSPAPKPAWMTPTAAAAPTLAYDNSYWAQQPAAVQALRTMPDSQRSGYAQQLAAEGYKIDVPIMVWGWDPSLVTSMRQADGYTWVPSGNQDPVQMAPGLGSMGEMAAYDPKNPPPGSIMVPPANSTAV